MNILLVTSNGLRPKQDHVLANTSVLYLVAFPCDQLVVSYDMVNNTTQNLDQVHHQLTLD